MITYSDKRLKDSIMPIGQIMNVPVYMWQWNDYAKALGADSMPSFGVIAQEVEKIYPEVITTDKHGYLQVDYSLLISNATADFSVFLAKQASKVDSEEINKKLVEEMIKSSSLSPEAKSNLLIQQKPLKSVSKLYVQYMEKVIKHMEDKQDV